MQKRLLLACLLALYSTLSLAQGHFRVVEKSGRFYYIEEPGPSRYPIERHTPGVVLGIPKGLRSVKGMDPLRLFFNNRQYIRIKMKDVSDSVCRQPIKFECQKVSEIDYEEVELLCDYPANHNPCWHYYLCKGEFAELIVAVRKKHVLAFLTPIVGDSLAMNLSIEAQRKKHKPVDNSEDYIMLEGHPNQKYSARYIEHQ